MTRVTSSAFRASNTFIFVDDEMICPIGDLDLWRLFFIRVSGRGSGDRVSATSLDQGEDRRTGECRGNEFFHRFKIIRRVLRKFLFQQTFCCGHE